MSSPPSADSARARGASACPPELARLQRWLQAAIVEPAAAAKTSTVVEAVEDVVTASPTQSAAERLAIYQHSYLARLLECLRAVFPALRHALGEPLFDRFAADYLVRHPPASYTLAMLAVHFPHYLTSTRPDAELPAEERAPWADFLVDLATLELAFQEVYDGEGLEDQPPPPVDEVVALPPAELLAVRFAAAPSLRLFAFGSPVHEYLTAARRGEHPALPQPRPTALAVARRDWRVRFHALFPQQHALLSALASGQTLGEGVAAASLPPWDAIDPAVLRGWLRGWMEERFFARVERA